MKQLDILTPPSDIDAAFWAFHHSEPQVFDKIIEMTKDAKLVGRKKLGMKMLIEVIRWQHLVSDGKPLKINNNYASRYVRLIDEYYPELSSMFEHRSLHS